VNQPAPSNPKEIKQEAINALTYLPTEEQEKVVSYIDGLLKLEKLKHEQGNSK